MIYQLLPNATEEAISFCENVAATQKPVSELIDSGLSLDEIIHTYFSDANILDRRNIQWHCECSKERFAASLMTLKDSEIEEMINDEKGAECVCQYCNTAYQFTSEDLKEILKQKHVENREC